jgi:nicotinate-nucleotide adenylyltransferase
MSTLCFGGSFNPIHNGHIACSRAVALAKGFDQLLLIPAGCPPHKPAAADLAAVKDRLAMCRLVVAEDPLFAVSDIEIRRTGPSYTIETVRQLRAEGLLEVNWLIGADMLNFLPKWREPDALLREVNFVVMARPGFEFDWTHLPEPFQKLRKHVVEAPLVDISATEIRRRARKGKSIEGMVPDSIARYITDHRLYK